MDTNKIKRFILLAGDIIILYFSLWLTLAVRYMKLVDQESWSKHWLPFTVLFVVWLAVFFINKMYDISIAQNNVKFFSIALSSLAWCAVVGIVFFYIATTGISPKTILALDIIIFGIIFIWWRRVFNQMVVNKKFRENAVIVGLTKETLNLAKKINSKPQWGLRVIAIVKSDQDDFDFQDDSMKIINSSQELGSFLKAEQIKTIIIDPRIKDYPDLINEIYKGLNMKLNIFDLPGFAEKFTGKILINTIGQMWFLENIKESSKQFYEILKRLVDILFALILLLVSAPFLPFIYIAIKINSSGPGFFMQVRVGKNGKQFMAIKFRTMYVNSEQNGPQWAKPEDPRVTRVGKFLRQSRIDEIPQLINVLKGEMSFIGPRPERPEFIERLREIIPFYDVRLLIKPGLTGWAQVNFPYGYSEKDALEKLQYDLYYIKNRSFIVDVSILLKTIKTVLSGEGH